MAGHPLLARRTAAGRVALVLATAVAPLAALAATASGSPAAGPPATGPPVAGPPVTGTPATGSLERHRSPIPSLDRDRNAAHELAGLGFTWPLDPPIRVAKHFIAPSHRYGPGHRGVDLAATPGARIVAPAGGTVWFAGTVAEAGVVSIRHDGGLITTYQPVAATVSTGDEVTGGNVIGTVEPGHPGCDAAACLHWGARRAEDRLAYLNPLLLVGKVTVRLKPVAGSS